MKLNLVVSLKEYGFEIDEHFSFDPRNFRSVIEDMEERQQGAYVFYDKDGNPLYAGRSKDLKNRFYNHLTAGCTVTRRFIVEVASVLVLTVVNQYRLEDLEAAIIYELKPEYNQIKNKGTFRRQFTEKYRHQCNSLTNDERRCHNSALENGYCWAHGGIGKRWQDLVEEEMSKLTF